MQTFNDGPIENHGGGFPKDTPQSNIDWAKEYVGKMTFVNDFLRKTYGLNDDDTLNAGEVEELCEMLASQLLEAEKKRRREEVEILKVRPECPIYENCPFCLRGLTHKCNSASGREEINEVLDEVLQKLS